MPGNATTMVSVIANVTVPLSNDTLKKSEGMLKSAVASFLNSGSNTLKKADSDQPFVKTVIINKINNVTQNVQGTEATNAIIGVEISKSLKTIVSPSNKLNQTGMATIETSSKCKPSADKPISCENLVIIN